MWEGTGIWGAGRELQELHDETTLHGGSAGTGHAPGGSMPC